MILRQRHRLLDVEAQLEELKIDINADDVEEQIHRGINSGRLSDTALKLWNKRVDALLTIDVLKSKKRKMVSYSSEANVLDSSQGEIKELDIVTEENFTDVVGNPIESTSCGYVLYPLMGEDNLLSVSSFFSRPVEIYSTSLPVGSNVTLSQRVWSKYTSTPSVRAKLKNYAFLRGDMCVRVTFSGTQWHYGKVLLSYVPYPNANQTLIAHVQLTAENMSSFRPNMLCWLSQQRGAVVADVGENLPIEMKFPFISPKGMFRLYNNSTSALAASTPYYDLYAAGQLYIYSINDIKAIGTSPSDVGFQLLAWMENVELGPPTATLVELSTESGDERRTGPVQRMASAMIGVSDALSMIPTFTPFAKASSIIFKGVQQLAVLFGWSKPLMQMDNIRYVRNKPYANTAHFIGRDSAEKVSWDPKQELVVDPRVCGVDEDELSIAYLCGIQTLVQTIAWADTNTPMVPFLTYFVHPQISSYADYVEQKWVQPTPMGFVAACFEKWRGTINFRLEIVCSSLHRGKLGILFEPNVYHYELMATGYDLNKNYIKIIDIKETQDVEFCVEYSQPEPFMDTYPTTVTADYSIPELLDIAGLLPTTVPGYANGFFSLFAFTTLQSPDASDVYINIYVSGSDMQFAYPTTDHLPGCRVMVGESNNGVSSTRGYTCFNLNPMSSSGDNITQYVYGEQIVSLRALLKRYQAYHGHSVDLAATPHVAVYGKLPIIVSADPKYGENDNTKYLGLFTYLPYAYMGVRGSMRHRMRIVTDQDAKSYTCFSASLEAESKNHDISNPTTSTEYAYSHFNGSYVTLPQTNGGIEFEMPYYSNNLFSFSSSDSFGSSVYTEGEMDEYWHQKYMWKLDHVGTTAFTAHCFVELSAGEDFTFMRFVGAPFYAIPL